MRIISKFVDYYDSAVMYGEDKSLVYKRVTEEIEVPAHVADDMRVHQRDRFGYAYRSLDTSITFHDRYGQFAVSSFAVAFCGAIYYGVKFRALLTGKENCFYDAKSISQFIKKDDIKIRFKYHYDNASCFEETNFYKSLVSIFKDSGKKINYDFFTSSRLPIVVSIIPECVYNYIHVKDYDLKKLQFFKVFDTYTAFQELSMFIGSMMAPENKEIIVVGDKHKIQQHGFDKFSFRKEPTKKR